jgi:hypothetical protein
MALGTSRRLGGVVSFTVDGVAYDVVSDLKWRPSTPQRETVKGQSRVEGYTEVPMQGHIGAVLRDNAALSVTQFGKLTNSTLIIQQANGKTIMGNGMWNVELEEVDTREGTFRVLFEGNDVAEIALAVA